MARIVVPEYPHHVTQRGVRSLPIFRRTETAGFHAISDVPPDFVQQLPSRGES